MESFWTKLSVRIATTGSLMATELVEQIGVPPSRSVDAGQLLSSRSTAVHKQTFCIYDSPQSGSTRPDEQIAWALEFLKETSRQLASLGPSLEIDIRLTVSLAAGQCPFALSPEDLSFLGALGVQLNIDLYGPDDESDD